MKYRASILFCCSSAFAFCQSAIDSIVHKYGTVPNRDIRVVRDTTSKPRPDSRGAEFVRISGTLKIDGDKFVLESGDHKKYRLACSASDNCSGYLDKKVIANGVLVQGYDNPKYGNTNLPIEQIDPKDVINIITSVRLEPDNQR